MIFLYNFLTVEIKYTKIGSLKTIEKEVMFTLAANPLYLADLYERLPDDISFKIGINEKYNSNNNRVNNT